VVQLHGRNRLVICLDCGSEFPRAGVQQRLAEANAEWLEHAPWHALHADEADFAPDGDANVGPDVIGGFRVVDCERCGGVLKPAVVFFGESVPREKVELAMLRVEQADALLVAGSSLTVWSGFRFVRRAHERQIPIAIVNIGPTRGDEMATIKVEGRVGEVLPAVVGKLKIEN
jgi:NAD-dependent deacetylase sirtuin 4